MPDQKISSFWTKTKRSTTNPGWKQRKPQPWNVELMYDPWSGPSAISTSTIVSIDVRDDTRLLITLLRRLRVPPAGFLRPPTHPFGLDTHPPIPLPLSPSAAKKKEEEVASLEKERTRNNRRWGPWFCTRRLVEHVGARDRGRSRGPAKKACAWAGVATGSWQAAA